MSPPGGPKDNGNGKPGAKILEFPGPNSSQSPVSTEKPPVSSERLSTPPRGSEVPLFPPSLFQDYTNFSTLKSLTSGNKPTPDLTPAGRISSQLSVLTNPNSSGGVDASFAREGHHYQILQNAPGEKISIRYSKEFTPKGQSETQRKPIFELIYYPDGRVGHISSFDGEGKPGLEKDYAPGKLVRDGKNSHTQTLNFFEKRVRYLGESHGAYTRLSAPLQQLRSSEWDISRRAAWYKNYVVLDGKIISIRTQNLGLHSFETSLSQRQITLHMLQGEEFVEVLRISENGEINHNREVGARQIPTVGELDLLNKVIGQVEAAHESPKKYKKSLEKSIARVKKEISADKLGKEVPTEIKVPVIAHSSVQLRKPTSGKGVLGEPIRIDNGVELFKHIRPFFPHAERWVNPTDAKDVRYLRPKGSIRWAMTKEFFRWFGSSLWQMTVNDVRRIKPPAGELRLHLLPDGTAELQIDRNHQRMLSTGEIVTERGLYNVLRRSPNRKTLNLGQIVENLAAKDTHFADLPRSQQLRLADQSIRENASYTGNPLLQEVLSIPINQLQVENSRGEQAGPRSAQEAKEAIAALPELANTQFHAKGEYRGSLLLDTTGLKGENFYKMNFPGSYPETLIHISEDSSKPKGVKNRVVVRLWQGDARVTVAYDDGILNHNESAHLNAHEVAKARQGHHRPWFPGWAFFKGTSMVRTSHYVLHGGSYVFGHYASMPVAFAYEGLLWNERQRKAFGTPAPDLSFKGVFKEMRSAAVMLTASGAGLVTTEGLFNWGGALNQMRKDYARPNVTFGQAWRRNSPRWHNEPPLRYRPIHNQGVILRNFANRGVPLLTGLLAVEMYHIGMDWDNPTNIFTKVDWSQFSKNVYRVGAVTSVSSTMWWGIARRTESAYASRVAGQPIRGIGGFLKRRGFMAKAARQVGRPHFAMTYRASLVTIFLEMAALRIWDSYDRKEQFLAQEGNFRSDLTRAIDRRSQISSRLEYGEEIPPAKIMEAQGEVESAYLRYRSYLDIVERNDGTDKPPALSLKNTYGEIQEDYRQQYLALSGPAAGPSAAGLLAQSKAFRDQRIRKLGEGE